ncbi:hypothetical protein RRG08_012549 [Elysia crispata]|uniref:Uncharacterized protein n=1 Tax=Elysia crispata TaxID=231223 RepID=A0AAE1ARF3_9GAST|nr:hypothetical protein RRG08_012549 [Elysia crispata]
MTLQSTLLNCLRLPSLEIATYDTEGARQIWETKSLVKSSRRCLPVTLNCIGQDREKQSDLAFTQWLGNVTQPHRARESAIGCARLNWHTETPDSSRSSGLAPGEPLATLKVQSPALLVLLSIEAEVVLHTMNG